MRLCPLVIALALLAAGARAETAVSAAPNPLDAAFAAMVVRPGDADAALRYAQLAAAQGNPRAAIAAIERALRAHPDRNDLRLELASLYLATGASALAALYAREAVAAPDIPDPVVPAARDILARAEAGAARSRFEATLFGGARYDSNANEATSLGSVPIFVPALGTTADINTPVRGQSSWSLTLGGRAYHRYDLELQREAAWETNATGFQQSFATIPHAYDLSIVALDTGPRIGVAEFGSSGSTRLAVRPFLSATWIGYGGDTYTWLYGGGASAELRFANTWSAEATWLSRFGSYENSSFRPRAREYTGAETTLIASVAWTPSLATRVSGSIFYYTANARQDFFARDSFGGTLYAATDVPVGRNYAVGVSGWAGLRRVIYSAADPAIDPMRSRRDTRWEAGVSFAFPITARLAVMLEYEWYSQHSNYALYQYGNNAATLGLRLRI